MQLNKIKDATTHTFRTVQGIQKKLSQTAASKDLWLEM